jgi:hypothetical protein
VVRGFSFFPLLAGCKFQLNKDRTLVLPEQTARPARGQGEPGVGESRIKRGQESDAGNNFIILLLDRRMIKGVSQRRTLAVSLALFAWGIRSHVGLALEVLPAA